VVLGLGRFGAAVARELQSLGVEVLGVDIDPAAVRALMEDLPRVVEADASNVDALREIGAAEMELAVVAIGSSLEASMLATHALLELGVEHVAAKAMTESHAEILARIGAHKVVFVERDMGVRVAHLLVGRAIEYLPLDDDFVLLETSVPPPLVGKTLADAEVRTRHGVSVVCIKPGGGPFTHAMPDTVLSAGDIIVVAGPPERAEAFAALS
jgi:trk system potassium uptake protein TrkA